LNIVYSIVQCAVLVSVTTVLVPNIRHAGLTAFCSRAPWLKHWLIIIITKDSKQRVLHWSDN